MTGKDHRCYRRIFWSVKVGYAGRSMVVDDFVRSTLNYLSTSGRSRQSINQSSKLDLYSATSWRRIIGAHSDRLRGRGSESRLAFSRLRISLITYSGRYVYMYKVSGTVVKCFSATTTLSGATGRIFTPSQRTWDSVLLLTTVSNTAISRWYSLEYIHRMLTLALTKNLHKSDKLLSGP